MEESDGFPDIVALRAFKDAEGKMNFSYVERFTQEKYGDFTREEFIAQKMSMISFIVAKSDVGLTAERNGQDGIEIRGAVGRSALGDMLVGEFFGWSTIGKMSLRELFIKPLMSTE